METLEDAIWQIYVWQHRNTNSFFSQLISLHRKADVSNRAKLNSVWPNLGIALTLWDASKDNGEALFQQFDIPASREKKNG